MTSNTGQTNTDPLPQWLRDAEAGSLSWAELAERLLERDAGPPALHRPDSDRQRRCGFGEVIFGSGKSAADIRDIAGELLDRGQVEVLATRVDGDMAAIVAKDFLYHRYDKSGRTLRLARRPIAVVLEEARLPVPITVVTAGSTDHAVASEALETLRWMGVDAHLITDVGVAGPYRLLAHLDSLRRCACIVVVAGMEGALASVLGGLVACPLIAVPTSVGYGSNFEGITTLLSMMSSCAAGVTVVNIDAGFKGGYVAGLVAAQVHSASMK